LPQPGESQFVNDAPAEPLREALRPPGPVQFEMREHRLGDIITVAVRGELDLLTAPKLVSQVGGLVRAERKDVVLDLVETQFIDSAGLAMLMNLQRRLERRGRRLRVVCDDGPVRRVIEMARLEETLGLVPTIIER
jgi:anti-sigma B factor antagonist